MKISAQEEYGLRCLLRIARYGEGASLTIPQISRAECISEHYTAKLLRVLRKGGLVKSVRGQTGGYSLSRPAGEIVVGEVLDILGGRLYDSGFCREHVGHEESCAHTLDCSLRSLWRSVQVGIDQVLGRTTLKDLLASEQETKTKVSSLLQVVA